MLKSFIKSNKKKHLTNKLKELDVIIYSGGKTGGTTLQTTFTENGFKSPYSKYLEYENGLKVRILNI